MQPVQHTNPWDFVPDQPKNALPAATTAAALAPSFPASAAANHCDSSSGVSSTGSNAFNFAAPASASSFANGGDDWFNNADGKKVQHALGLLLPVGIFLHDQFPSAVE